jgi:hypothetical protein
MNRSTVVLRAFAAVAAVGAATFAWLYFRAEPATSAPPIQRTAAAACGDRIFGHISSLTTRAGGDELRFDPAWFTTGLTANTAAAEDGAVAPGQPVPNDNYVVDEGHRLLTYLLPADARVTVLTRGGEGPLGETSITVSELERIVNGGSHRPLFEPLDSGVWIRVNGDTVCSLDQQYRP